LVRKKSLLVYNSDRKFNYNLLHENKVKQKIRVDTSNYDEVKEEMDKLRKMSKRYPIRNDKEYIIYNDSIVVDSILEDLCTYGYSVAYYTDSTVPYWAIKLLSNNKHNEIIYKLKDHYEPKEIENLELASMGVTTIVDAPIEIPNINPNKLLLSLHDLKVNLDKVQFNFVPLASIGEENKKYYTYSEKKELYYCKPKYQYQYIEFIRESLSYWKQNIYIICDDIEYHWWNNKIEEEKSKR